MYYNVYVYNYIYYKYKKKIIIKKFHNSKINTQKNTT